jgi:hypothetical protein
VPSIPAEDFRKKFVREFNLANDVETVMDSQSSGVRGSSQLSFVFLCEKWFATFQSSNKLILFGSVYCWIEKLCANRINLGLD